MIGDDVGVADRIDDPGRRLFLKLNLALPVVRDVNRVVLDSIIAKKLLKLGGLLVAQIEETVPRMMRVETELSAVRTHRALRAHYECFAATATKFVLALVAGEVHATYDSK